MEALRSNKRDPVATFAHQTNNIISAKNSTTIAKVIPVLKELSLHLEKMSKVHGVGSILGRMLIDLMRWFQSVTDPSAPNVDPVLCCINIIKPTI